jgi:hypothetical protein
MSTPSEDKQQSTKDEKMSTHTVFGSGIASGAFGQSSSSLFSFTKPSDISTPGEAKQQSTKDEKMSTHTLFSGAFGQFSTPSESTTSARPLKPFGFVSPATESSLGRVPSPQSGESSFGKPNSTNSFATVTTASANNATGTTSTNVPRTNSPFGSILAP